MKAVDTGQPSVTPISWATVADRLLCTAQVPIRTDGTFESGGGEAQLRQVFANLRTAVEAGGGSLADVMQVVVYLVDMDDFFPLNRVWSETFAEPRPSRAVIGCSALAFEGLRVSITATAWLAEAASA